MMHKSYYLFSQAILLGVAMADQELRSLQYEWNVEHECLELDADHIVWYDESSNFESGGWIDDGEVLDLEWESGWGVRAINYCIDDYDDTFQSMQIMVGAEGAELDAWTPLRKHGADGGTCRRWILQEEDYIRIVQYTWNRYTQSVVQVVY